MKADLLRAVAHLREVWAERPASERLIASVVTGILIAALGIAFAYQAHQARTQLRASVTALRAQAAQLEKHAQEYEGLRASPPAVASRSDLRTLVQAQAGAAGLTRALTRAESPDSNQVQVEFGAVAFADWIAWAANMETQRVRIDSCRVEALSSPGLVRVTATLSRTP